MLERLTRYWVYGGFLAGLLLLCLLPELARDWSAALLAVFLQLPVYMLHQYEEHDNDRFRQSFNQTMGGGREVLSPLAVFLINVPGVWGVIAVSFYLSAYVSIGYGLIAAYLTLVNALVHIAMTIATRSYNPGLATAALLFLPASTFAICELHETGQVGWHHQLVGMSLAVAIHLAIIGYIQAMKRIAGSAAHGAPTAIAQP
ncbi:MAG TPA: HXXEE domain-containing protein [Pirellulales bacterium]|nr:HXXEE domain-containing protein [Pirellulales bacterium]